MVSLPPVVSFAFADTGRSLTPRLAARLALFVNFIAASYGEAAIASGVPRRMRLENHNRHRYSMPQRDSSRLLGSEQGGSGVLPGRGLYATAACLMTVEVASDADVLPVPRRPSLFDRRHR